MKMMKRHIVPWAFLVAAGLAAAGCGGAIQLTGTQIASGADAELNISDAHGGSRMVELHATHLPPPARLRQGMTVFALWAKTRGQSRLLGFMEYDEGSREGTARGTTPYPTFQVILTAERNRTPQEPSDAVVFRQGGGAAARNE